MIFLLLFFISEINAHAEVYTDKKRVWIPEGKTYDIVCFNEKNLPSEVFEGVVVSKFRGGQVVFKEKSNLQEKEIKGKNCILEQKETLPVARLEFTEALFKVRCDLNFVTFEKEDFRILRKNSSYVVIKRLTDGKIWALPARKCKTEMSLPAIKSNPDPISIPLRYDGTFLDLNKGVTP